MIHAEINASSRFSKRRTPLARDWLTYWLLDMGKLRPRDFEQWIAGWPRPEFLRMPDIALPATSRVAARAARRRFADQLKAAGSTGHPFPLTCRKAR
jgi:hypothetical protein